MAVSKKSVESQAASEVEQVAVPVDESHIAATYANFCRVTGTPEELMDVNGLSAAKLAATVRRLVSTR